MSVFSDRTPQSPLSPSSVHPGKKQKQRYPDDIGTVSINLESVASSVAHSEKRYVFDELREICTLGTGSFGTVKLVHHELSGDVMALVSLNMSYHMSTINVYCMSRTFAHFVAC
jgi:hypothetical protein